MKDLKEKVIRGAFARVCAQGGFFALRVIALMVLARLVDPKDFGLVGMVTAFTGVLNLFRDFGLSTATVQRVSVSEEQISTLFWINVMVGAILGIVLSAGAPMISRFYHEPRLFWVTIILATGFLFNAAGVQHSAMLQREMRFTALAVIQIVSLGVSSALGILVALAGYGYWALVVMSVTLPMVSTACFWLATSWIPGRPHRNVGVHSLLRFGGAVTFNSLLIYFAYNLDKILLGRFWGAEALGLYGRSYQIISLPTDNLNSAVGEVAFAALSRLQDQPSRLRSYFLKGYSLVLALTVPITTAIALYSHEIVAVVLGPKWNSAAGILRMLAPTIFIFALINPVGWLLFSMGMIRRCVKIALVILPTLAIGYAVGLPYGAKGVAIGYSVVMTLLAIPLLAWGIHGTVISRRDIANVVTRLLIAGLCAAGVAVGVEFLGARLLSPFLRLVVGCTVLFGSYAVMLLYVMGQKDFYIGVLRGMKKTAPVEEPAVLSA